LTKTYQLKDSKWFSAISFAFLIGSNCLFFLAWKSDEMNQNRTVFTVSVLFLSALIVILFLARVRKKESKDRLISKYRKD